MAPGYGKICIGIDQTMPLTLNTDVIKWITIRRPKPNKMEYARIYLCPPVDEIGCLMKIECIYLTWSLAQLVTLRIQNRWDDYSKYEVFLKYCGRSLMFFLNSTVWLYGKISLKDTRKFNEHETLHIQIRECEIEGRERRTFLDRYVDLMVII